MLLVDIFQNSGFRGQRITITGGGDVFEVIKFSDNGPQKIEQKECPRGGYFLIAIPKDATKRGHKNRELIHLCPSTIMEM